MQISRLDIEYEVYEHIGELPASDERLLIVAREATARSYAPYSHFKVGAAILLANGEIVKGANQENASFPLGLCAERVALASVNALYPGVRVEALAISYDHENGSSNTPVSPCGICRQVLAEQEQKFNHPIRLILGGLEGKVFVIAQAGLLLPLSFSAEDIRE